MGVRPTHRIMGFQGTPQRAKWKDNPMVNAEFNLTPRRGYIVTPTTPSERGESYGITRIVPQGSKALWACEGMPIVTFRVPANSIVYVGDIFIEHVQDETGEYRVHYEHDYETAKQFMEHWYPRMADRLQNGRAAVKELIGGGCGAGGVIVVVT